MKNVLLKCLLVLFVIFIAGCSKKTNEASESIYNKINNWTIEDRGQDENIVSKTPEATDETADDELSGFTGLVSEIENSDGDNLSINSKLNNYTCLVCPDIENNIIYYVNYGKDDYIYQLNDDVSSLVIDRKTRFIQLWEGELYFFGYTDEETGYSNIYKYNFISKQVELLVETNPCWMYINQTGIYYARYNIEKGYTREGYRLSFGSTEPEPYDWFYFVMYKDYMVVFERVEDYSEPGTIKLIKQDTGECVLEIKNVLGGASIYQDNLYYISLGEANKRLQRLHIINLLTGEHNICDPNDIYSEEMKGFEYQITDYTVCGEDVFCTVDVGNQIFKYNKEELLCYLVDQGSLDTYDSLYTDGSRIFMSKNVYMPDKDQGLVELIISDDLIETKELGE